MDLKILNDNPELARDLTIQAKGIDLIEFAEYIITKTKENSANSYQTNEEYLTREETTKILKVSLGTLWTWNKKGILCPFRIGNKVRYKRSQLDENLIKINND